VPGRRKRDTGHVLRQEIFRLDIRKIFSSLRTAQHWDRLPREAAPHWSAKPPSSEVFKTQLDKVLSNWRSDLSSGPAVNRRLD